MLKVEAIGTIHYTCELSDEDEAKVINYIKSNQDSYIDEDTILKAIEALWAKGEIELYENAIESDYSTEEILWSEFEDRSAEEILGGIQSEEDE